MKIAILIPDRGDRPRFLENCLRMMNNQTLKPHAIHVVNFPPTDEQCDITKRYRLGYEELSKLEGVDLIALIENDDWYSPDYLEYMADKWIRKGRPDIFGTNYTIYYHLKLRAWFTMTHYSRASAMNTFIKPRIEAMLNPKWWPVDQEPFTDLYLWSNLKGISIEPERHIAIGMKHGEGLTGGRMHTDKLHRFEKNQDPHFKFLRETLDWESFKFYKSYFTIPNNTDFLPSFIDL